jgi:hypothetical protein
LHRYTTMMRPIAFSLLLAAALSYPVALLCMDECEMRMGGGRSSTTPFSSTAQTDLRECCLESALVSKQWEAKPLPKVIQLDAPPPLAADLVAIGLSHTLLPPIPPEQSGSPPTLSSFQVLRI